MGRGRNEPVIPGVTSTPSWKVKSGSFERTDAQQEASGLDWDPDIAVEEQEDEVAQAELEASDSLFTEEEFQQWSSRQAVLWIANAANAFEVMGFRAKPLDFSGQARRRYLRLSLLTHPDKTQEPEAGAAFQKLSHAMRILSDEEKQQHLLRVLFPQDYGGMSEGERQIAAANNMGLYSTANDAQARKEQLEQKDLESKLKEALQEKEQLKRADQEASERFKRRGALAGLAPSAASAQQAPAPSAASFTLGGAGEAKRLRRAMAAAAQPAGRNLWGLPEAFAPPPAEASSQASTAPSVSGSTASTAGSEDPNELWQRAGALGLASQGWRRQESRSQPGKYYFLHEKTGKTVMHGTATSASSGPSLPEGWERRESRSKPGVFYYANLATGETRMDAPPQPQLDPRHVQGQQPQRAQQPGPEPGVARTPWPWELVPEAPPTALEAKLVNFMSQSEKLILQLNNCIGKLKDHPLEQARAEELGKGIEATERLQESVPQRGGRNDAFRHGDLWPEVNSFIKRSGLDEQAAQVLLAAPLFVQRRLVEGPSLEGCSNPSAAVTASVRRLMNARQGGAS